jgi:hypothetical protein
MLRVLHGPVNVGNQPWVLSRQERALGLRSDLVVTSGSWLRYQADRILHPASGKTWYSTLRQILFGFQSAFRYDVLHYYFGRTFLGGESQRGLCGHFLDLKLARRLGRKVFMTLQGCDARLSARNSDRNEITMCHLGQCQYAETCRASLDAQRNHLITDILPLCDRVFVLNPDMAHDIPGAVFLPYANVDVEAFQPVWPRTEGPITLLHAPTDERIKGTSFFLRAVERLQKRWPIELLLVRGMPHEDALRCYRQADLLLDNVLGGWYGGVAVETMALGKPIVCYLRDTDLGCMPARMRAEMPMLRVRPDTLEADLEALFLRRREWPEWGRQARQYVLRWHHPRRIAAVMARAYREPGSPFDMEAISEEWMRCAA